MNWNQCRRKESWDITRYYFGICSQGLKKVRNNPVWTAGVLANNTTMQLSRKNYCISQLSQSRHSNTLPPECGMSDKNPSVLWKRKPDCDVEYCTNWSAGTGVTLLMVSQYVMLQTHTMLSVSNSRGTHGLSAAPESNIWKWHLIYNDVTFLFLVSCHSSNSEHWRISQNLFAIIILYGGHRC